MTGQSDPYVMISVPGVNFKPIKTKSIKNSANPEWNETHSFDVSSDYLKWIYK